MSVDQRSSKLFARSKVRAFCSRTDELSARHITSNDSLYKYYFYKLLSGVFCIVVLLLLLLVVVVAAAAVVVVVG